MSTKSWPDEGTFSITLAVNSDPNFGISDRYVQRKINLNGLYRLTVQSVVFTGTIASSTATTGNPNVFVISPQLVNSGTNVNYFGITSNATNGVGLPLGGMFDYSVTTYLQNFIDINIAIGSRTKPSVPANVQTYTGPGAGITGPVLLRSRASLAANDPLLTLIPAGTTGLNDYWTSVNACGPAIAQILFYYKKID